jgi:hypothetical protein
MTSLYALPSWAAQADDIEVTQPYAREVPPGAPASASFMMLNNLSDETVHLVGAESEAAQTVELHTHTHDNGVMRMRQIDRITVPANGHTELKPGGLHIMLIGPKQPLKAGQQIQLRLIFEDGSQKALTLPVQSLKTMQPNQPGHNMPHQMH